MHSSFFLGVLVGVEYFFIGGRLAPEGCEKIFFPPLIFLPLGLDLYYSPFDRKKVWGHKTLLYLEKGRKLILYESYAISNI